MALPMAVSPGPDWRKPVLCRLTFGTATTGTATVTAAKTSPGLSVVESLVTDGLYAMTFPACRKAEPVSGNVHPATPGTASTHRSVEFDDPVATSGTMAFRTREDDTASGISSPEDLSTVTIWILLDLG
jgi:hypothetical protein